MNGIYIEKLPISGAELVITQKEYEIKFYFSGPDFRYNGTTLYIQSYEINDYIEAYKTNWENYCKMKSLKLPGQITQSCKKGMEIRIGGFNEGLCIRSYHLPINNEQKLDAIINEFEFAKKRGEEMVKLLKSIT